MLTNRSDDPRVHRWHWHHIYFTLSHICYSKIWQCVLCSHQNEGKIKKTKNFSSFLGNEDLLGSTRCRATGPSRSPRGRGPPRPSCDCRSTWKRDYLVFTKYSSITTDPTNAIFQSDKDGLLKKHIKTIGWPDIGETKISHIGESRGFLLHCWTYHHSSIERILLDDWSAYLLQR